MYVYAPGDYTERSCPRILLIPVYTPYESSQNQLKSVKVTGFAYFYITAPMSSTDTSITGMFIKRAGTEVNRFKYSSIQILIGPIWNNKCPCSKEKYVEYSSVTIECKPQDAVALINASQEGKIQLILNKRPALDENNIIIGEVRWAEALDMLQAMNTGHDGSLATGHSNSPRDMIARLETMVLLAGVELPVKAIREQVSSAIYPNV